MQSQDKLAALIKNSFGYQRLIFYSLGGVAALTGVGILILSFTILAEPGEENIVLILQGVAVLFILFGAWSIWYMRSKEARVRRLLYEHPEELVSVKAVTIQKSGVHGRAIHLRTKDNKVVGFNVNGPERQQALLVLIQQHLGQSGLSIEIE